MSERTRSRALGPRWTAIGRLSFGRIRSASRRGSTASASPNGSGSTCIALLLSAPAVAGHAPPSRAAPLGVCALRDLLEQPGVRRDARVLSRGVDDRLEGLGKAKRDPGAERILSGRHRCALLLDVDELGVAACEADVDVAVRQLLRQLRSGLAEDIHQAEPEGWLK